MSGIMRELMFHIGVPKTGSSALQVFFARNHDTLRKRGVDYFRIGDFALSAAGNISSGNGSLLSRALLPAGNPIGIADPDQHERAFFDAIAASECPVGLVSSEIFADADLDAMRRLLDSVRERGVVPKAFMFARRQDQFLSSAYMQQVKRHQCTEYPEVYVRRIYRHIRYLRYNTFYRELLKSFGDGNVIVRTYEEGLAAKGGLFATVLSALGVDLQGFNFDVRDINTSLSTKNLVMMLLLNKYQPRMNFSDSVVENEIKSGAMHSGVQHQLFSDSLSAEIENYFRDENTSLAVEYFERPDLFDPVERTGNAHSISRLVLSVEDAVGFLGGLAVRLDARVAQLENQVNSLRARAGQNGGGNG